MVKIILIILMLAMPAYGIDLDIDNNDVLDTVYGGPNVAPGTDPDVDALGEYGIDTDDFSIRGWDGSVQFVYSRKTKSVQFGMFNPDDMPVHSGRSTQSQPIYYNDTAFSFIIISIRCMSDADDYSFELYESNSDTDIGVANDTLIDAVTCSNNGTGGYYKVETSISAGTINSDHYIIFEHVSGAANSIHVTISGYLDGDVD